MKKYFIIDNETGEITAEVYVSTAEQVEAVYKSIRRATKKFHTSMVPFFVDPPKFNYGNMYGLFWNYEDNMYHVVKGDTVMYWIWHGDAIETNI